MKKKTTGVWAQVKKKKVLKETQRFASGMAVLATCAGLATVMQFAKSDELDDLLSEVGGSQLNNDTCNSAIDLAQSLKGRLFSPYRAEIAAIQASQVNVAVSSVRAIQKDISREEWGLLATGASNLRRLAVQKARIELRKNEAQAVIDRANERHNERQLALAAELNGEVQSLNAETVRLENELRILSENLLSQNNRLMSMRTLLNETQNAVIGYESANGFGQGVRADQARQRHLTLRQRQCQTGRRQSQRLQTQCGTYAEYVGGRERTEELERDIPALDQAIGQMLADKEAKQARIAELRARIAEINRASSAQVVQVRTEFEQATSAARQTVEETSRLLERVGNAQVALERQMNFRAAVLFRSLREAHQWGCRSDLFMSPSTLRARYRGELNALPGNPILVPECLNLSEAGWDRHTGLLQTCRILPRRSSMEDSIVGEAGHYLSSTHYRACVALDLTQIDDSFFDESGGFRPNKLRSIIAPTEDWLFMVSTARSGQDQSLNYNLIDVVSNTLPQECRAVYHERRFQEMLGEAGSPASSSSEE